MRLFKSPRTTLFPLGIMILSIGMYWFVFDKKLDLSGDNVKYFLLGKALADGDGYTSNWQPETPAHTHFPPGYPILVAIGMKLGLKKVVGVKLLNYLFLMLATCALYRLVRELGSTLTAGISALLFFFRM